MNQNAYFANYDLQNRRYLFKLCVLSWGFSKAFGEYAMEIALVLIPNGEGYVLDGKTRAFK